MVDTSKVFVVLDPTSMEQPSLVWGEKIALDMKKTRSLTVQLHVYCCLDPLESPTAVTRENTEIRREATAEWLERTVMHTRALGIPVETEVETDSDWRQAIVRAAGRVGANVVIKNLTQHTRLVRLVRETADWQSAAIKCKFNPVDAHSVVSGKSAASAQVAPYREGVIDLRERSPASWHRRQFRVLVGDKGSATAVSSRLLFAEDDLTLSRMEEDEGKMSTPGCLGKLQAQLGTYAQRLQEQVLMAKECEPWLATRRDGLDNS